MGFKIDDKVRREGVLQAAQTQLLADVSGIADPYRNRKPTQDVLDEQARYEAFGPRPPLFGKDVAEQEEYLSRAFSPRKEA